MLESSSQHFARHLLDIDQHRVHHHNESPRFAEMDFDFGSSQDITDEEHACDSHFHGVKLVALPFSALAVEVIPAIHEQSDISTSVRSAFPPPLYRPPIV